MEEKALREALQIVKTAESLTEQDIHPLRLEFLERLVTYAKMHSPLFARLYQDIDTTNFALTDLPITYKQDLIAQQDDWFTDRRLNTKLLEEYLASEQFYKEDLLGTYTVQRSSGTTGKPILMVHDEMHNALKMALIRVRLLRGINPKFLSPQFQRIACVIFTEKESTFYEPFIRAQYVEGKYGKKMKAFSVQMPLDEMVNELNKFAPNVLFAYPSMLIPLAREYEKGNLKLKLKLVISVAEPLTQPAYQMLCQIFKCPVVNNYITAEGGCLASSCSNGHLHLNADWVILEPVDKNRQPVTDGSWSDGVLVTDLSNFVQPVIRYYLEDQIKLHPSDDCESFLPVVEVRGTNADGLTLQHTKVDTSVLKDYLEKIEGLLIYQFIQKNESLIEFRSYCAWNVDKKAVEQQVMQAFEDFLKRQHVTEKIELRMIDEHPLQSAYGGKSCPFRNECQ